MPLLNIVSVPPSFQYWLAPPGVQSCVNGKALSSHASRHVNQLGPVWRFFLFPEKFNWRIDNCEKSFGSLRIQAVATLEPECHVRPKDELNAIVLPVSGSAPSTVHVGSSEDSDEPDEREKLRRMRISEANKGNTPWNKGRKHSPETIQRIRERTKLAMQTPKVKSKLMSLGHFQSNETRKKIGIGVRMGWRRRREKLKLQETCLFNWQNLIAESARSGLVGEEELQWDSYKILNKQLQQEWLESIEQRKVTKPKGSKRAPKSIEQRRKIAEAIAAKWADPEYRERVCTGLAKHYGIPEGRERKVRKRTPGEQRSMRPPRKVTELEGSMSQMKMKSQRPKLRRNKAPVYTDPFAITKLEMIKNIRAERAASEVKNHEEALQRARLLIAEAEKAAKALEPAATMSPIAQASLIETRKLISEAIQSLESIEKPRPLTPADNNDSSIVPTKQQQRQIDVEKQMDADSGYSSRDQKQKKEVNGSDVFLETSENCDSDSGLHKQAIRMQDQGLNDCSSSSKDTQLSTSRNGRYNYSELPIAAGLDLDNCARKTVHGEELPKKFRVVYQGLNPSVANGSLVRKGNSNAVSASDSTVVQSNNSVTVQMSSRVEKETRTKSVTKKWVRGRLVEVVEDVEER